MTATIAGLAAVASGKGLSPWISALAVDVLLGWFFWFERGQVRLSWLFGGRVRQIEVLVDKRRLDKGGSIGFSTPNIARSLFGARKPRALISKTFANEFLERLKLLINREFRLALTSDVVFYFVLGCAAWLPVWFGLQPQSIDTPRVEIHNLVQSPSANVVPSLQPRQATTSDTAKGKPRK